MVSSAEIHRVSAIAHTRVAPTREATPAPAETPATAPPKEDGEEKEDGDGEEGGPKILSKKEKEKLKTRKAAKTVKSVNVDVYIPSVVTVGALAKLLNVRFGMLCVSSSVVFPS